MVFGIILGTVAAAVGVVKNLAIVGLAVQGLKKIGNILTNLGKALGLIKPETKIDELGDKALQSEYKPEDYDSYAEYVKAVEKFDLDAEKSNQISEEDKIKKGMELSTGVIIEEFDGFPIQDFCVTLGKNPEYFTSEKMGEIAKLIKEDGKYISNILNYVNGTEKDELKLQKTIDALTSIDKHINPSISDKDALKNVLQIRK
jgi:Sec-independent protein translocase protein TatA